MPRYASYRKFRKFARRQPRMTFSKFSTYKNRTSKAQAYQIYRLNKKINYIQKRTKPEVSITPILTRTNNSGAINVLSYNSATLTNLLPEGSDASTTHSIINGRFARLQSLTIKGLFTYALAGDSPYADIQRMPCILRVVLVQTRTTRAQALEQSDIFNPNLTGYAAMRGPLATGLARIAHVLSDKQYYISDTKQLVNIKTKLKYLKNWYTAPSDAYAKGNVEMHSLIYSPTGPTTNGSASFTYVTKVAYTDA